MVRLERASSKGGVCRGRGLSSSGFFIFCTEEFLFFAWGLEAIHAGVPAAPTLPALLGYPGLDGGVQRCGTSCDAREVGRGHPHPRSIGAEYRAHLGRFHAVKIRRYREWPRSWSHGAAPSTTRNGPIVNPPFSVTPYSLFQL